MTKLETTIFCIILLINAVTTIHFHKSGKLTIYKDYTDAAFTSLTPLVSIVFYYLFNFIGMSSKKSQLMSISIFLILTLFVVKETAKNNNGLSIFFAMSLIAKETLVFSFYLIVFSLIFGAGSSRKKRERYVDYEARKNKESEAILSLITAITSGFIALSACFCKNEEFTSIKDYFSLKNNELSSDFIK